MLSDGGFSRFGLEKVGVGAELFRRDEVGGEGDLKREQLLIKFN